MNILRESMLEYPSINGLECFGKPLLVTKYFLAYMMITVLIVTIQFNEVV